MPEQVSWEKVNRKGTTFLSPAYKSNGHVFCSGSVGTDAAGKIPTDVKLQTEIAIKNLEGVLKASGSSLDRVLKVLLFVAHPADAAKVNEVYAKYFITKPARSCIVVGFPNPEIKVELECVAEYKEIKSKL